MDFSWAENYPEVLKVCTLFSLSELSAPLRYSYRSLDHFLQDGPQCGLVALAMYAGCPSKESVQCLLDSARQRGYTNHGEMYSASFMTQLAKSVLKSTKVELFSSCLDCGEIRDCLLKGACILVPYDKDKDHSPCLERGLKAHWAIVSGAVETETDFYVIVRHGTARNVAVWKLRDLSESNAQLDQIGVYPKQPDLVFKVPEGGIQGPLGLKNQSVILWENTD